jgi:pimeloyl-ACP methyl ester carboxylesterase
VHLVLLHALPLSGAMWLDDMDLPVDSTITPTLYRFGDSVQAWAEGVLDVADTGPLVVVGNSVGGSCALEVARQAPDRVAAVVLIGAKAGHRREPALRDQAIRLLTEGGMAKGWPEYWAPLFGTRARPDVVEAARQIAVAQDITDVIRGVLAFHSRPDRTQFVHTWRKPLIVISGDQDRTPPPTTTAALASSAPNGEFHLVEDTGHYVNLERPQKLEMILRRVMLDLAAYRQTS